MYTCIPGSWVIKCGSSWHCRAYAKPLADSTIQETKPAHFMMVHNFAPNLWFNEIKGTRLVGFRTERIGKMQIRMTGSIPYNKQNRIEQGHMKFLISTWCRESIVHLYASNALKSRHPFPFLSQQINHHTCTQCFWSPFRQTRTTQK